MLQLQLDTCLVLVGRHDRNVGVHQATEVAHRIPRARLHVFERSAHFPDLQESDEFLRAVVPFPDERTLRSS